MRRGCRHDRIAAIDEPLQGFVDLVGRKILLQPANKIPDDFTALRYRDRESTIKFAVEEELPIFGIQADRVG